MKKIIYICLLMPLVFQSCKKAYSPGDNYDFSNPLPPYVAFKSLAAVTVKQGASATVSFLIRTALQQAVTVTYSVSGAVTLTNQTVVIPRDAVTINASIPIPAGTIVAPATTATATVTLVKATAADGSTFTVGANNVAASQVVTLKITP
jgi:hypothetical protein